MNLSSKTKFAVNTLGYEAVSDSALTFKLLDKDAKLTLLSLKQRGAPVRNYSDLDLAVQAGQEIGELVTSLVEAGKSDEALALISDLKKGGL